MVRSRILLYIALFIRKGFCYHVRAGMLYQVWPGFREITQSIVLRCRSVHLRLQPLFVFNLGINFTFRLSGARLTAILSGFPFCVKIITTRSLQLVFALGPNIRPFLIISNVCLQIGMPGYSVSFCFGIWYSVFAL